MFDASDVAALVSAAEVRPKRAGGRAEIASRLSEIANSFLLDWHWQQKPSPSRIVKRLNAINSAANQLLAKLPQSADQSEAEVRYRLTAQATTKVASGSERLRAAIDAVKDIAAWSKAAKFREATRKGRKVGHRGDKAMQRLIGNLYGVWLDFWGRIPGATTNAYTGEIGGPYIRFVLAFLRCLETKIPAKYSQANPGLGNALRASPSAIRERLRLKRIKRVSGIGKSSREKT